MDLATLIGLLGAFALVAAAILLGGHPEAFFDGPAVLIVIGGTFFATMICFSIGEVIRAQLVAFEAFRTRIPDPARVATQMLEIAEEARDNGVLALDRAIDRLAGQPFLRQALTLVVDGTPGEELERILNRETAAMNARHSRSAGVFRKAAEVAPAMGLIGTLVGLVQMLGTLDDPSTIGPSMAVALLTTFYGAILANMVFAPLASKLERNSGEEAMVRHLYLLGAASISRQENPRRLEMMLNTVLPPAQRVQFYD